MGQVIVLNLDYQYLNKISWKKAISLIYKGKVEVVKESAKVVKNFENTVKIAIPTVVRLLRLVRSIYRNKVPFSKRTVLIRDEYRCQYCGTETKRHLTLDHIVPKSRGGKTTFENCVGACSKCNSIKNNRTPSEAHMSLLKLPTEPTIMEFILIQMRNEGIMDLLRELGVY